MRGGRVRTNSAGAAVAWALALIAACAAPRPPRPAFTPSSCPETPAVVNRDLLPECVWEHSADPEPTCVPLDARGREIARDDDAHLRVYDVCIPESLYTPHPRLRIDPARVIVERTGERRASWDELETIASLFGDQKPSRAPDLPNGKPAPREGLALSARPETFVCGKDGHEGLGCLQLHLLGPRPDPARLLAGIAKWLPSDGTCIAMQVDSGWREGCPEVNVQRPQEQAAR